MQAKKNSRRQRLCSIVRGDSDARDKLARPFRRTWRDDEEDVTQGEKSETAMTMAGGGRG